jgi:hypothetical protein
LRLFLSHGHQYSGQILVGQSLHPHVMICFRGAVDIYLIAVAKMLFYLDKLRLCMMRSVYISD